MVELALFFNLRQTFTDHLPERVPLVIAQIRVSPLIQQKSDLVELGAKKRLGQQCVAQRVAAVYIRTACQQ